MKKIVLIGAGGLASEVHSYMSAAMKITFDNRLNAADSTCSFLGFLSTSNDLAPYEGLEPLFLGDYADFTFAPEIYAAIAIGDAKVRARIYAELKAKGANFINIIDPSCNITPTMTLGLGNIFAPFTHISPNVTIGNNNLFNGFNAVGHDVVIGDDNAVQPYSSIAGFARVGSGNYIASACTIFPKATVGDNVTLSAGSVLFRRAKSNGIYMGNPAKRIGNEI